MPEKWKNTMLESGNCGWAMWVRKRNEMIWTFTSQSQ